MNKNEYMEVAIVEAKKAYIENEVPIGAIVIYQNKIISKAYNMKEQTNDISAHAEIIALKRASEKLGTWKLDGCEIYVTVEPCLMCYSAIKESRIKKIYCGTTQLKYKDKSFSKYIVENKLCIEYGIKEKETTKLLNDFFQKIRRENVRYKKNN